MGIAPPGRLRLGVSCPRLAFRAVRRARGSMTRHLALTALECQATGRELRYIYIQLCQELNPGARTSDKELFRTDGGTRRRRARGAKRASGTVEVSARRAPPRGGLADGPVP